MADGSILLLPSLECSMSNPTAEALVRADSGKDTTKLGTATISAVEWRHIVPLLAQLVQLTLAERWVHCDISLHSSGAHLTEICDPSLLVDKYAFFIDIKLKLLT